MFTAVPAETLLRLLKVDTFKTSGNLFLKSFLGCKSDKIKRRRIVPQFHNCSSITQNLLRLLFVAWRVSVRPGSI